MTKTYDDPERYNGWTNRETWAVALHINNDQGWQESVLEALREGGLPSADSDPWDEGRRERMAGEIIRDNVEETLDMLLGAVARESLDSPMAWHAPAQDVYRGVRDDIGSLWRVDWTELGAAFLSDLAEGEG